MTTHEQDVRAAVYESSITPKQEELLCAITMHDLSEVQTLLEPLQATDLDFKNAEGLNPLLLAAKAFESAVTTKYLQDASLIVKKIIEKAPQLLKTRDERKKSALQYLMPRRFKQLESFLVCPPEKNEQLYDEYFQTQYQEYSEASAALFIEAFKKAIESCSPEEWRNEFIIPSNNNINLITSAVLSANLDIFKEVLQASKAALSPQQFGAQCTLKTIPFQGTLLLAAAGTHNAQIYEIVTELMRSVLAEDQVAFEALFTEETSIKMIPSTSVLRRVAQSSDPTLLAITLKTCSDQVEPSYLRKILNDPKVLKQSKTLLEQALKKNQPLSEKPKTFFSSLSLDLFPDLKSHLEKTQKQQLKKIEEQEDSQQQPVTHERKNPCSV